MLDLDKTDDGTTNFGMNFHTISTAFSGTICQCRCRGYDYRYTKNMNYWTFDDLFLTEEIP